MIWATVSSWSYFCWLYRASPSLAAKNIISLISEHLIHSNINTLDSYKTSQKITWHQAPLRSVQDMAGAVWSCVLPADRWPNENGIADLKVNPVSLIHNWFFYWQNPSNVCCHLKYGRKYLNLSPCTCLSPSPYPCTIWVNPPNPKTLSLLRWFLGCLRGTWRWTSMSEKTLPAPHTEHKCFAQGAKLLQLTAETLSQHR